MFRSLEHYKEANGGSIEILKMPRAAAADDVGAGIPKVGGSIGMPESLPAGDGDGSPEADGGSIEMTGDGSPEANGGSIQMTEIPPAGGGDGSP